MAASIFLGIALLLFLLCLIGGVRNQLTYEVRHFFIWVEDPGQPEFHAWYDALPGYWEMVFHPRHWHRWTISQWKKYIDKKLKDEKKVAA